MEFHALGILRNAIQLLQHILRKLNISRSQVLPQMPHPKAKEFLFTEGTFQQLSRDNAVYAQALIDGKDVSAWHMPPEWQDRAERSGKSAVKTFDLLERTAARMAQTAFDTAAQSGQISQVQQKDKGFLFAKLRELELLAAELLRDQQGLCALTGIAMILDGQEGDPELRCSLDRIDSSGHYERGNLQVVCKFANRWKSASDNDEFKRLIDLIRGSSATQVGDSIFNRNSVAIPADEN